jgi:hypothetical protein
MVTREDTAMKPYGFLLAALSLTMLLSGCFYVHTVEPLTVDMRDTPVAKIEKEGTMKVIAVPFFTLHSLRGGKPLSEKWPSSRG